MKKFLAGLSIVITALLITATAGSTHEGRISVRPTCTGYHADISTTAIPNGITITSVELWGDLKGAQVTENGIDLTRAPGEYKGGVNITFSDGTISSPSYTIVVTGQCSTTTTTVVATTTTSVEPTTTTGATVPDTTTTVPDTTTTVTVPPTATDATTTQAEGTGESISTGVTLPRTGAGSTGTDLRLPAAFLLVGLGLIVLGRRRVATR